MSTTAASNDSPIGTPIQPLHNPSQAAHVVIPQAQAGNTTNAGPGMGAKALLAKKLAKTQNANYVSPTDKLMTPCSQKLNAVKKKQFSKGAKPVQLFARNESSSDEDTKSFDSQSQSEDKLKLIHDNENPF
ncbi:hypothetical protein AMATHDRAFT_77793 [Amanita thiersii Skay4041]|uniref:Spo12 family protein n=1 Tax=Amanita thiersii Skay4041 TaxID=703135 RepID=A0A2A9NA21_9AGAR|nr:hypothetical protein AMATHDRAFT_77793 [Amanita thiersii Skay4041]